ncbi:MAG TPA: prepilin-type N-terminal cleavage/methylation domain-containing protein [Candidatus Acidoferrum sp.]|nr:prepilin-type N-terminal cleavage/methylation domain-containing protein [Candidatus Acidoferrum sp.]
MKKQAGFTMVEFMVAMGITLLIFAAAVGAITSTMRSNQNVALTADLNDNLRASLNLVRQDIVLAGEGIPAGGISIPTGAGITINRPGPVALKFQQPFLPALSLGTAVGPTVPILVRVGVAPGGGAPSDMVTLIYQDNTWDSNPADNKLTALDSAPITRAAVGATPACNGNITPAGDAVTFDINCVDLSKARVPVQPGDLFMFSNINGTALQTVTSIAGQVVSFASNPGVDKFGLNQTGAAQGTIVQLQTAGTYPPITASRIWMISYYLDIATDPKHYRLVRQVNFNPTQPVAEIIEGLQLTYNFVDANVPPTIFANSTTVPAGLTENNIRSVNLFLGARANAPSGSNSAYIRDNMKTQISIRSLAYFNKYN